MNSSSTIDEATILARVMGPEEAVLSPAVSKEFLTRGFTEADHLRMSELSAKARAGTLSAAEQTEAEGFARVSSFLGLVKSKARRSLKMQSSE